jgi:hypothetical protein
MPAFQASRCSRLSPMYPVMVRCGDGAGERSSSVVVGGVTACAYPVRLCSPRQFVAAHERTWPRSASTFVEEN